MLTAKELARFGAQVKMSNHFNQLLYGRESVADPIAATLKWARANMPAALVADVTARFTASATARQAAKRNY
jgi:hypothetical protein